MCVCASPTALRGASGSAGDAVCVCASPTALRGASGSAGDGVCVCVAKGCLGTIV